MPVSMPVIRGIVVGLVGAALLITFVACRPTDRVPPDSGSQALSIVSETTTRQQPGDVVWGRVPYCSCLVDSATDNVADALKDANLTVSLKELSPRDGWLYFVVSFDPQSATSDQVGVAMVTGGAEVLEGPP